MMKRISKLMMWVMLFPFIFPPIVANAGTQINLTTQVAGVLPIANGGTGSASGVGAFLYAHATGTSDAITANYPNSTSSVLTDGFPVTLGISAPNATSAPTFAPTLNGVLQTARTIKKFANNAEVALASGDLQGDAQLVYDLSNTVWVLQNPSIKTVPGNISPLSVTMAASAATITTTSQYVDFRSTDLTSGAISTVYAAPSSLTIPSGASLGCLNAASAAPCQVAVLEILSTSGVAELAVTNTAGGLAFDEDELISTTAISAGATASGVYYSTNARTNVPYRVLGWFESSQTTAGAWVSQPSTVQGCGGNSCSVMTSLGYGQTWQNVTGSRTVSTTYYNTTGKPIFIMIAIAVSVNGTQTLTINGVPFAFSDSASVNTPFYTIIPIGGNYSVTVTGGSTIASWNELR